MKLPFSVGVLYSIQDLLDFAQQARLKSSTFPKHFGIYNLASGEAVLRVALEAKWIAVRKSDYIDVTQAGLRIASFASIIPKLRAQLKDLVLAARPAWSALIPKGRTEASKHFPPSVWQCFEEAGLLEPDDQDTVEWWDSLSSAIRSSESRNLVESGRQAERLSLEYEMKRVGIKPVWEAIESNVVGYDILSVVSKTNEKKLLIEVKSTTATSKVNAFLYLTRNEWDTAAGAGNYVFHLWKLVPKPSLRVIRPEKLGRHVPQDTGLGNWDIVRIPFFEIWEKCE